MPKCSHCHREWTYGQTLKRCFRLTKKCPYCGKDNFEKRTKQGGLISFVVVLAFILLNSLTHIPLTWVLPLVIVYLVLFIFVRPVTMKLVAEQQPYW